VTLPVFTRVEPYESADQQVSWMLSANRRALAGGGEMAGRLASEAELRHFSRPARPCRTTGAGSSPAPGSPTGPAVRPGAVHLITDAAGLQASGNAFETRPQPRNTKGIDSQIPLCYLGFILALLFLPVPERSSSEVRFEQGPPGTGLKEGGTTMHFYSVCCWTGPAVNLFGLRAHRPK